MDKYASVNFCVVSVCVCVADAVNLSFMESLSADAARTGSLKRSSSFKKLLKLPTWASNSG